MSSEEGLVSYRAGQVIFVEGDQSNYLYLVMSGKVGIFKEDKNKIAPIAVIGAKDFIGEMSMFSDENRSASAIALVPTELVLIKKSDLRKVVKACPDWVSDIMVTLCDRLRHCDEILKEHSISRELVDGSITAPEILSSYAKVIKDHRAKSGKN
jgi:CRP-like cAMP-binding protein